MPLNVEIVVTSAASQVVICKAVDGAKFSEADLVATEEPLEIVLCYGPPDARQKKSISITMRTPGHDRELAAGFLFTEGIVRSSAEIEAITICGPTKNTAKVELKSSASFDLAKLNRHFYQTSSCGICGKSSLEALKIDGKAKIFTDDIAISASVISELPNKLKEQQEVFAKTGGLHGCGLFSAHGELLTLMEDVGRHNAVDKAIGQRLLGNTVAPPIMMVSGRISFEIVQKALMAQIPILAAVSAPSSLAIELAQQFNMTLIGFVRENRMNIYSSPTRVV